MEGTPVRRDGLELPPGEPEAGPWVAIAVEELARRLLASAGEPAGRPRVVAIDGRSGAGKSTVTQLLLEQLPPAEVVHTDDLAWHEPLYGWGHLLADLLEQVHRGGPVSYRPPQWEIRGRDGAIEVPADVAAVLVEGTGASQREHAGLVDVTVWVQADHREAERRGLERDIASGVNGTPEEARAFWDWWMEGELAFFVDQRPWERADLVVNGTPGVGASDGHVTVAAGPGVG